MRVLALSNAYIPVKNTGGQFTLHAMLQALVASGAHVELCTTVMGHVAPYCHDGIPVHTRDTVDQLRERISAADIVVAQLDAVRLARVACTEFRIPLVHVAHTNDVKTRRLLRYRTDMVVYISPWLHRTLGSLSDCADQVVVHAPVDPGAYRTAPGDHITMINLSLAKGVDVFYALAEKLPHRSFMGVIGDHEEQIVRTAANITIVQNSLQTPEAVYARTRLLLMPSRSESFGRVGVEAAASGIPTVASEVEGLPETLAGCAVFLPNTALEGWEEAVERMLGDSALYDDHARKSVARADELWAAAQRDLAVWVDRVGDLAARRPPHS